VNSDEEKNEELLLFRNNDRKKDRGDILIRGLWAQGTDCIIDVRIADVDAKSNQGPGQSVSSS
jgi:hypothetical protein